MVLGDSCLIRLIFTAAYILFKFNWINVNHRRGFLFSLIITHNKVDVIYLNLHLIFTWIINYLSRKKMDLLIRADWTNTSQYYIDFDRGQILHSRAASRGQSNKFFRTESVGGTLKHLTYAQAASFYVKNKTIELYLMYLREVYYFKLIQVNRRIRQRSISSHSHLFAQSSTSIRQISQYTPGSCSSDYFSRLCSNSI